MNKIWLLLLPFVLVSAVRVAAAEEKLNIGEVVVTATRVEESVNHVAQDVTVITKKDIEKGSYKSVTDVLKNVLGVNIRENGDRGSISTVSMRGSNAQQVLVLIDGKRMNKPGDGQVDLNTITIPLEDIERIEVLRGASSALYGADAMGGVINIITKKPSKPVTTFSASYGRFDTKDITFSTSREVGKIGYLFSANKEASEGFRTNSDYDLWGADWKFTLNPKDDFRIDISADYNHRKAGVPGSTDWPTPQARQNDENVLAGIAARFKDTTAKFYSNNSVIRFTDPSSESGTQRNHVNGVDVQSSIALGSLNFLTGGAELIAESVNSTDIGKRSRTRKGAFVQDEITPSDKLILDLGLRYDDFDLGSRLSPRASLLYKILEDTTLRFSAGAGYRIPTLNDLYWPDSQWEAGNPDLKPERSMEYEASVERSFGSIVKAKALVFHKDEKDLIVWQQEVDSFKWMPENISRARINGFEFDASANFKWLDIRAEYYYQDPTDKDTGEKIINLPRHQITGTVTVYPYKETSFSLEGRYVSNYVSPGAPDWCYFVVDAKLSQKMKFPFGEGELFITGENILDRDFETVQGYPMPPVEISGGIGVKF